MSGVEGRVKKLVSKDRRHLGCRDRDWMLIRMKRRALLAWRKTRVGTRVGMMLTRGEGG